MRVRDNFRVITSPFDPTKEIAIVPAITPDIALVHALRADGDGNLVVGRAGDDPLLIQASKFVIATTEEITPEPITVLSTDERLVPGIYVDVIAPAPNGTHPLRCQDLHREDSDHLRRYLDASRDPDTFAEYLRTFIFEPADHAVYLDVTRKEPVSV